MISQANHDSVRPYMATLVPLLLGLAASEEIAVRNMAGECLGKLALVASAEIIPVIMEHITHADCNIRSTMVVAVKFTVTGTSSECDSCMAPHIPHFLATLGDENVSVRRAALLTINTMVRNKPDFIRDLLTPPTSLLQSIYGETKVKEELIRTVVMGPFKHKVDDGLEIRQAAFECLDTILEECIEKVEPNEFMEHLAAGLQDDIDVKMICQLLLLKATDIFGAAVAAGMGAICAAFAKTIKTKPKADAVPTEVQTHEDCLKSVLRCVVRLSQLEEQDPALNELIDAIKVDDRCKDKYVAAQEYMAV